MRPVSLELEGFTAFRERTAVDLDGVDLFVLCGDTGAGKSSLIDAMTFALYGSVPRYDDVKLIAPVISQGKVEAKVRFDFRIEGTEYTAVRVVRRQKEGAATKEARLESNGKVLAGSVRELDERIRELIGLTFDQFTKCVVLPQGEFARFLRDPPAERQELLKGLLGMRLYERLRELAGSRETAARQRAADLGGQLAQLAGATPEARRVLELRVRELDELRERLDAAQAEIDTLVAVEREQRALGIEHANRMDALDRVRVPRGADKLAKDEQRATGELRERQESLASAERKLDAAEKAHKKLPDPRPLEKQIADWREHDKQRQRLDASEKKEAQTAAARRTAEERVERARAAVEEAARAADVAVRAHAAHHLASVLAKGAECPVCFRPVAKKPRHPAPPGLDEAHGASEKAKADLRDAERAAAAALSAHAADDAAVREIRAAIVALDRDLRGAPAADKLERQVVAIAESANAVESARAELRTARAAERDVRATVEGLADRLREAWGTFGETRDRVAAIGPPAPERDDLAKSWVALVEWAEERAADEKRQVAAAHAAVEEVTRQTAERRKELGAGCQAAGVACSADHDARDAALAAAAAARAQLARIDADADKARKLDVERKKVEVERATAHALAQHLRADRFERWLLQEALHRLVVAAGTRLREVSTGAYSFRLDGRGDLAIVDHRNADETRSVKTLSGGETFLASLALALTLAEQIVDLAAGGAARLESMFLDEGFGTLDAETLDTVAATIEELGSRGRVVGIVTHVRELADRIPVQYRIAKGAATSTVERVTS